MFLITTPGDIDLEEKYAYIDSTIYADYADAEQAVADMLTVRPAQELLIIEATVVGKGHANVEVIVFPST